MVTLIYSPSSGEFQKIVGSKSYVISKEEARKIWETKPVHDYNIALHRVVVNNWDMEKVEEFYNEN